MMNKKEQARLEQAEQKFAVAMALHWPSQPEPKPRDMWAESLNLPCGKLLFGWAFHANGNSFRVTQGCSDGMSHDTDRTDRTSTQHFGRFYYTRQEAYLAARWELCRQYGVTLARLDAAALNEEQK